MSKHLSPRQRIRAMLAFISVLTHPQETARQIQEIRDLYILNLQALKGDTEALDAIERKLGSEKDTP